MEYLEFELRMSTGSGGVYPIAVVHSPAGEASATMRAPLGDSTFRGYLQTLDAARGPASRTRKAGEVQSPPARSLSPTTMGRAPVEQLGRALFDILLPGELRSCYRASLQRAREQGKGLRVRLRIEAPDLAILPWEYVYDTAEGDYVCLNSETPLVRYVELARPPQPLTVTPPLRILGMVANPPDLLHLDVEREKRQLALAIDHLLEAGYVTLDWLGGETWVDLQTAMRRGPWHVFHFIGHGAFDPVSGEGLLALTGENSRMHLLSATQLARLFAGHQSLRLAVLNACEGARASETDLFSSVAVALTRRGIPAVVSMQHEISDEAALEFSRMFYDALKDGLPVDAAVTEARKAISLAFDYTLEWGTPVLHMRPPNGQLFDIDVASAIFRRGPAVGQSPEALRAAAPPVAVPSPQPVAADRRRGLLILLRKVKQFWVQGVLEQSLHRAALIDLGMELVHGAVDNPWGSLLDRPGAASQPLPPGQTMRDVFDDQGGSLLILGEPGSGKTTTLLSLARDLLSRAEQEPSLPIPVVFNLSSWRDPAQTMFAWLVDELSAKYQIPKAVSCGWLKENRLLPLLDGLDEVSADRRTACVEAINRLAQEAVLGGLVVCCRLKEYIALPVRLMLNAAVRLEPLTEAQVGAAVAEAGPRLAALRAILRQDSALRLEARSPLMLSLMMLAYQDLPVEDIAREGFVATEARRKQLMDAYVVRKFRRAAQGGTYA